MKWNTTSDNHLNIFIEVTGPPAGLDRVTDHVVDRVRARNQQRHYSPAKRQEVERRLIRGRSEDRLLRTESRHQARCRAGPRRGDDRGSLDFLGNEVTAP